MEASLIFCYDLRQWKPKLKTLQKKTKQIIYDVLNEQLSKVATVIEKLGFRLEYTAIISGELAENEIVVALYEKKPMEMPKGKKQKHFRVNSIVSDHPCITE